MSPDSNPGKTEGTQETQDKDTEVTEGPDEIEVTDPVSAPDADGKPRRATRRFPLFTRDTARPEGGGRAAPRDAPAPARQWPILAVLGTVGLGLLLTAFDVFRYGILLIGAALLAGAVLRWVMPDVGMLAVRSRFTDIVTYAILGLAIVLLALMAQPKPWLTIPYLKDTLHYTVSSNSPAAPGSSRHTTAARPLPRARTRRRLRSPWRPAGARLNSCQRAVARR